MSLDLKTHEKVGSVTVYSINSKFDDVKKLKVSNSSELFPAETSTVDSTIKFGLKQSESTIRGCFKALNNEKVWKNWSPESRLDRFLKAGRPELGL